MKGQKLNNIVQQLYQKLQQIDSEITKELSWLDKRQGLQHTQGQAQLEAVGDLQRNPRVNLMKFLKKWEIINNVVQGIIKSVSVISVERYHLVNDIDFKIHNKIEMQSVFRNIFERCKFKDYCPFVFEQIRRISGISNESFVRSIGLNTFQTAFVH